MTFRTFSHSLILFFAFSLHYLESQIDTYVKGHHAYKDTWTPETGESHDAQIKTNNPVDKYAVCIREFGQVVGHLKKWENDKFEKAMFFFLRGDPYSKAKTIRSGRRCNLRWWWRFADSLQTKARWSSKFIDLFQDELIKLKEI